MDSSNSFDAVIHILRSTAEFLEALKKLPLIIDVTSTTPSPAPTTPTVPAQ